MKKITIIGASGQGKVVADIAKLNGYDIIEFLDDNPNVKTCGCYQVVGNSKKEVEGDVFVAIGNGAVREKLSEKKSLVTLIHPKAIVAEGVKIGEGTVIMAGAVINPGVVIGKGCIINTSSSIDHDCVIGNYVHVSVGAHLCGTVNVGNQVWIGAGAIIINNVDICDSCFIGAGGVVIKKVELPGTYVGVPAKMIL